MPIAVAAPLTVSDAERAELDRMARSSVLPYRCVRQARALLWAADGVANNEIARRVDATPDTVRRWRTRFEAGGVNEVGKITRGRGRKPKVSHDVVEAIVNDTLHSVPDDESTQLLPARLGEYGGDTVCGDGLVVVVSWWWSWWRGIVVGVSLLFGGDFGDGGAGGGFVDDVAAGGVRGDECLNGEVVHGSG